METLINCASELVCTVDTANSAFLPRKEPEGLTPSAAFFRNVLWYGAWVLPAIPFVGTCFLVFGSSILYYVLRKEHPETAKAINRHAWKIGGVWLVIKLAFVLVWVLLMS